MESASDSIFNVSGKRDIAPDTPSTACWRLLSVNPACKRFETASTDESVSPETALNVLNAVSMVFMPTLAPFAFSSRNDKSRRSSCVAGTVAAAPAANPPAALLTPDTFPLADSAASPRLFSPPPELLSVASVVCAWDFNFSSELSVATISLCKASYLSCPRSPRSNAAFACTLASFKVVSFCSVFSIASESNRCFCDKSSVLDGSSFKSRSTSFNEL